MMDSNIYRRCGCVDHATGRRFGARCPRLVDEGHGSWYYAVQVTDGRGRWVRSRRGGYATCAIAERARRAAVRAGRHGGGDEAVTVRDWLYRWLASLSGVVRPSTLLAYRSHVEQYLSPGVGRIRLVKLTTGQIQDLFAALAVRVNRYDRALSAATLQRVRATLRRALNVAVRERLIAVNPVLDVVLTPAERARPVLWSSTQVMAWRETGWRPAVGVWTPRQLARFLAGVAGDPLYGLWWLAGLTGLRRGELTGLRWTDIDLSEATLTVCRQRVCVGGAVTECPPKTAAARRTLALDPASVRVLQAHRRTGWSSTGGDGPVFCWPDGRGLRPDWLTHRFRDLAGGLGLPPVRLHDLRHGAATMALAAGADIRTVQELLGHTSYAFTADTYTCVLSERMRQLAQATARMLQRLIADQRRRG